MSKPAEITTPYPSLDRVAALYGVSKKRQAEIAGIVDAMYSKDRPAPLNIRSGHVRLASNSAAVTQKTKKR
jgi:hypothetical protein